jgi:uracil-DNA glycosylase
MTPGLSSETEITASPPLIALMPMGLCFPGTGDAGDLPPRPECAPLWHPRIIEALGSIRLTILIGQYAQARYLTARPKRSMTEHVCGFRSALPGYFPLPHPSWRSTMWMRRNPWLESEVLPDLRRLVADIIS